MLFYYTANKMHFICDQLPFPDVLILAIKTFVWHDLVVKKHKHFVTCQLKSSILCRSDVTFNRKIKMYELRCMPLEVINHPQYKVPTFKLFLMMCGKCGNYCNSWGNRKIATHASCDIATCIY